MNYTAIIPAKTNSRRLANKNMQLINGETLIELAIKYAKKSKKINKIIVSTDSTKIKQFVDKKNICDCIIRNKDFNNDTDVYEIYKDALEKSEVKNGIVIGLQPDNPDRDIELDQIIKYFNENKFDDLFSVGKNGFRNGGVRIFIRDIS